MIDASKVTQPVLVEIDFAVAHRADPGPRPVLHRPSASLRSPLMDRRSHVAVPRNEVRVEMPPIGDVIGPLVWMLLAAVPIFVHLGSQAALVAGASALVLREARLRVNRSTISFGDGLLGYSGTAGWPHGVQEDDDVRWNWSATRPMASE